MTVHIYSSHSSNSRAVLPGSLGSTDPRHNYNNYSLLFCYNGVVHVTSPLIDPLGFYLAPVPSDRLNQVDVWFPSPPWHGQPQVQVAQSGGSFTQSFEDSLDMPLNGYLKLDMYANTLTQLYKKSILMT